MDDHDGTEIASEQFLRWTTEENDPGGYKRKKDRMAFVYTNEEIIGMSKSVKIGEYIEKLQQSFLSHILRREDNAIVKQLTFNSEPSRRQGRHTTLH